MLPSAHANDAGRSIRVFDLVGTASSGSEKPGLGRHAAGPLAEK